MMTHFGGFGMMYKDDTRQRSYVFEIAVVIYTTNHGNMYLYFKFVASLRRYAESYLLLYKPLTLVHII